MPAEFSTLDARGIIRHSTRIRIADDRVGRRAARVALTLNAELERYWKELAGGHVAQHYTRYDEARRRARTLGYDYILNDELIALPSEQRLQRLEAIVAKGLTNDAVSRAALLGTAKPATFALSRLFEEYETATRDEVKDLSPDQ